LAKLKEEDKKIIQLHWYIFVDQKEWIEKEAHDGKTKSEVYRRVVDSICSDKSIQEIHEFSETDREKEKDYISLTKNQYQWITSNFPSGTWAKALRKIIDIYKIKINEGSVL
jgi:hypothetical protein